MLILIFTWTILLVRWQIWVILLESILPPFVHCVYISGGVHHSNNALCCPLRPIDPGCHPAWVHGRYQSLPPYRFQAAQQSWGKKLFVVVRPRCEILNVMHRPFDPSFFSFEFLMKLNYFKSIFAHWTATKYAENLEGWIFFFLPVLLYCILLYAPFFHSWAHVCTVTLRVMEKFTKAPCICSSVGLYAGSMN